jgi:Na+/proline symporter
MAGRTLFPGLADPETILPQMSADLFPAFFTGVFLVVVLAAIMSTVDSLLILASSAVVRDYLQKIRGSSLSEKALANRGKLLILIIGVIGIGFALQQSPMIFWLVIFAWNGLGATFGPPLLCGLWYPKTNFKGALAGMLGGFITTVTWVLVFKTQFYNLSEIIPGFLVGLLLTIIVSNATFRKPK